VTQSSTVGTMVLESSLSKDYTPTRCGSGTFMKSYFTFLAKS
jgi:hypothetical protein